MKLNLVIILIVDCSDIDIILIKIKVIKINFIYFLKCLYL